MYIHSTLVQTISEIITNTFSGIQRTAQVIITGKFYRCIRAGQDPEIQVLITGVQLFQLDSTGPERQTEISIYL